MIIYPLDCGRLLYSYLHILICTTLVNEPSTRITQFTCFHHITGSDDNVPAIAGGSIGAVVIVVIIVVIGIR